MFSHEKELEYQRTNQALGLPVDVDAIFTIADAAVGDIEEFRGELQAANECIEDMEKKDKEEAVIKAKHDLQCTIDNALNDQADAYKFLVRYLPDLVGQLRTGKMTVKQRMRAANEIETTVANAKTWLGNPDNWKDSNRIAG